MKYLLLLLIFTSCHTASYTYEIRVTHYGIDYSEGKWLLNDVHAADDVKEKLTQIAYKKFNPNLGGQLVKAKDLKHVVLTYLPMNPDTTLLKQVKRESNFDYIINIEGNTLADDIGPLKIGDSDNQSSNHAEAIVEIYDLNTLEIIYSRKVSGSVTIDENDNEDFAFVKSTNGIMVKSLKKILKKIK